MGQTLGLHRCSGRKRITMALRILALATDAYGTGGGIAQYNRDLFQALAQSENVDEVVILPRNGQVSTQDTPPKVHQLQARSGRLAFALHALRAVRQDGPFDVVFCGHLYMAPLAAVISKLTGTPVWLQIHGIEAWQRPSLLQRWAAEHAHFVTAVSRHTRRLFLTWANCSPEKVRVLPNTVDERFTPGAKPVTLLDRYNLHGKKVLLTVSRLAASEGYKGHDRVIRAVANLRRSHPDINYVVAGDGDDRPRLEQLTHELDVAEQVHFIGHVPDNDLPDLYRAADVFVMPSTGEGFGIVFLQAQASGVPVIGGDSDGSRDPLRDGMDGRLVQAYQTRDVAAAIAETLQKSISSNINDGAFSRSNFQRLISGLTSRLIPGFDFSQNPVLRVQRHD